jgi:hypothetical protein
MNALLVCASAENTTKQVRSAVAAIFLFGSWAMQIIDEWAACLRIAVLFKDNKFKKANHGTTEAGLP